MIFPEKKQNTNYVYNPSEEPETWGYGEFLRKTSHLLKDGDEKWKLVTRATEIQNTWWPSNNSYNNALKRLDDDLSNHIGTHEDPFIL